MRLLFAASLVCTVTLVGAAQDTGLLRITVAVTDMDGNAVPVPRAQLLISDNPSTREPRRVRTGADGTIEINLPAGNYTVESDVPVRLGARNYAWTQILDVAAGRETVLELTAENSDTGVDAAAPDEPAAVTRADGAVILNRLQRSVAAIWTPARHATGFVVDARGLIATSNRALGDAVDVEVEFGSGDDRVKVAGRVVASERTSGVSLIWINPAITADRLPIAASCDGAAPAVAHDDSIVTIIAPILEPATALPGTAIRPESQAFRADWRLDEGSAGGPVFAADGTPIGITVGDDDAQSARREDSYVIPLSNVCGVIAAAEKAMAGAAPPPADPLRTEAGLPRRAPPRIGDSKQPRLQPPVIRADDYDVTLMTPAMVSGAQNSGSPRMFFGRWSAYVANAPQVLLVRVSPQFEESFWRMLARGAASTQGVMLPPMPSFSAAFGRMRAYCGGIEVMPIHRFTIEVPIDKRDPVREALYVFAATDFGPQCTSVRVELFSEKSSNKGDSRVIDPALLAKVLSPPGA